MLQAQVAFGHLIGPTGASSVVLPPTPLLADCWPQYSCSLIYQAQPFALLVVDLPSQAYARFNWLSLRLPRDRIIDITIDSRSSCRQSGNAMPQGPRAVRAPAQAGRLGRGGVTTLVVKGNASNVLIGEERSPNLIESSIQ